MPRLNAEDRKYFDEFLQKAVELNPSTLSPLGDLDDPVHPLFEQENFLIMDDNGNNLHIPDTAYAAMLPALRLASLLITAPALLTVFDHIANGLITGDAHGKTYIAKGSLQGTALGLEFVRCLFMYMATDYRVTYAFWYGYSTAHDTLGLQRFITQREHWRILGRPDWATDPNITATLLTTTPDGQFMARKIQGGTSGICFHKHFIEYSECGYAHDTHAGRLAALLTFVDVLMHETTHAFAAFVHDWHGDLGRDAPQSPEPRYSFDCQYHELGITWGSWFTGGVLLKPVHALSFGGTTCGDVPAVALILFEFKIADREGGCGYSIVPANKRQWTLLTADTIRMLFVKATWERDCAGEGLQSVWQEAKRTQLVYRQAGKHGCNGRVQVLVDGKLTKCLEWTRGVGGGNDKLLRKDVDEELENKKLPRVKAKIGRKWTDRRNIKSVAKVSGE